MALCNSFGTRNESIISLQYNCRNLDLEITAKYDIDMEERMDIDDEPSNCLIDDFNWL